MTFSPRFLSVLLTPTLIFGPVSAQTSVISPTSSSNAAIPGALQLKVDTDAPELPAGSRSAKGFLIEVRDANGNPVPDAAVTLRLPDSGASGTFSDGSHATVAYTDQTGHATVSGIQWGPNPGFVSIRVTANKGTAHAGTLIQQALTSETEAVVAPRSVPPAAAVVSPVSSALPVVVTLPGPPALPVAQPVEADPVLEQLPSPPPPPMIDARANASAPGDPRASANVVAPRLVEAGQPAQASAPLPTPSPLSPEPSVTVSNAPNAGKSHSSKTKWLILAAVVAAGAGAGIAMMGKKGSSAASSSGGVSVGSPTISVGHP